MRTEFDRAWRDGAASEPWGAWELACTRCGTTIMVVATIASWRAGTTEYQQLHTNDAGELVPVCRVCRHTETQITPN